MIFEFLKVKFFSLDRYLYLKIKPFRDVIKSTTQIINNLSNLVILKLIILQNPFPGQQQQQSFQQPQFFNSNPFNSFLNANTNTNTNTNNLLTQTLFKQQQQQSNPQLQAFLSSQQSNSDLASIVNSDLASLVNLNGNNGNCQKYFPKHGDGEWLPTTLMPLSYDRASEAKVRYFCH